MRTRIALLTYLAHSAGVHVATENLIIPATQVRISGVVSMYSFTSHLPRSTRQLREATTLLLVLVPIPPDLLTSLEILLTPVLLQAYLHV